MEIFEQAEQNYDKVVGDLAHMAILKFEENRNRKPPPLIPVFSLPACKRKSHKSFQERQKIPQKRGSF